MSPKNSTQQVVELARLAGLQRDRLEVAEPGHDRLQQAPDRRHHDRQRAVRLAGAGRVGEPPQHGDPLPYRVQARRQPLVRQGLPAGEVRHAVGREEGAERGRQVVGLPGRGGDREHEPGGARLRAAHQRGRQHRPQRRRRDQVFAGERGNLAARARPGVGRRPALRDRADFRARDHAPQLRIVVENGEQSCEAHDVLVIAFRPLSWPPCALGGTVTSGGTVPERSAGVTGLVRATRIGRAQADPAVFGTL